MRNFIVISVVGSVATALLVAGCGGGGAEAEQIDKATFVKQADQICEQVSGKMSAGVLAIGRREAARPGYDVEKTQIDVVTTVVVPGLEEELQKLRALGIPEDASAEAKAFVNALQKGIEQAKAKPKATAEGYRPYEAAEVNAAKLGISECPITSPNSQQ